MKYIFDNSQPIYQQIVERIQLSIARGEFLPGAKVMPVRELALEFNVNPNTMQRALAKLEDMKYLFSERTSGRYVTNNLELIESLKAEIPARITKKYVTDMVDAGMKGMDIPGYVARYIESNEGD